MTWQNGKWYMDVYPSPDPAASPPANNGTSSVNTNVESSAAPAASSSFSDAVGGDFSGAAEGGYVLYPNKPNTNMSRAVYAK